MPSEDNNNRRNAFDLSNLRPSSMNSSPSRSALPSSASSALYPNVDSLPVTEPELLSWDTATAKKTKPKAIPKPPPIETAPLLGRPTANKTPLDNGGASSSSVAAAPLFGRPSKKNSLEDDLPDARRQAEQHSAFVAQSSASARRLDDDDDDYDEDDNDENDETMSAPVLSAAHIHVPKVPPPSSLPLVQPGTAVAVASAPTTTKSPPATEATATVMDEEAPDAKESLPSAKSITMSSTEMEEARGYARTLRELCDTDAAVDVDSLDILLTICKEMAEQVKSAIESAVMSGGEVASLEELFQLNEIMMHATELAERTREGCRKPSAKTPEQPSSNASGVSAAAQASLDIQGMVEKKDIFSLICMLRAQQQERRLDAALALMNFARDADQLGEPEHVRVAAEIRSSGGMHSLLTLFRTRGTLYEVKVVVAMAVAYLVPSFVTSTSSIPPNLALKIVECLRVLSRARKITPNGQVVTKKESFKAAANGLFWFWINQLLPMFDSEKGNHQARTDETAALVAVTRPLNRSASMAGRVRNGRTVGGGLFDQRRESIELQELLEITVSQIIFMAHPTADSETPAMGADATLDSWRYALVEQVCALEIARPIAVREGMLSILVEWIKSSDPDKIRPAASALRHLTSIKDKYMAGWIHSQMVKEGALQGIVNLFDRSVGHDVQLAVAQILSSLCVAPHTRTAVVEANGIALLIQFLCEHKESPSQEGALFAGSALLQLAAGAITRASVFGDEDFDVLGFVSLDKRDNVVDNIIESGAIESFVEIALTHRGKLRSVAVEALRVLSEDISPSRQTRGQLCYHNAAEALGVALKESVEKNGELLQTSANWGAQHHQIVKELHETLCALANILDPIPEGAAASPLHHRQASDGRDTRKLLINGCMQTTDSGGLESLLFIASLPLVPTNGSRPQVQRISLLEEACRSLASMSPLLLTDSVTAVGYAKWTTDILKALYIVLRQIEKVDGDGDDEVKFSAIEVQVNVLRGLGALARSEPLKVGIVDKFLPYLLQANSIRDGTEISNSSNQAFQNLGFIDDEVAVQVAGNNPQLLADWFCLERSCLIQAMARSEIRRIVQETWGFALKETNDAGITKLMRETSDFSRSDDGSSVCLELFDNFAIDSDTAQKRDLMLRQYNDIYGRRDSKSMRLLSLVSREMTNESSTESLLARQIYPLESSHCETAWILAHQRELGAGEYKGDSQLPRGMSPHVCRLLEAVFPSQLLCDHVLPINSLRPGASFNFRALMMPQRRYFSFRREGQLLSSLCAAEAAAIDTTDVHWTLGFTNSSFAGEFTESLVQALYLCPMILGLSFSKNASDKNLSVESEKEESSDEGGAILANLAGSLPPWISFLTFDGLLGDRDLRALVAILETMGRLSAEHDPRPLSHEDVGRKRKDGTTGSGMHGQGRFSFFAIRRSLRIREETWLSFFKLVGRVGPSSDVPTHTPLSSLTILDLSGNQLGDHLCASILELAHDKESGCALEELDLSGNRILTGTSVLKVLRGYVEYHRYPQKAGRKTAKKSWKSPLHTLYLANNGLHLGKAWLELVSLLKHNALELQVLDLSSNGLVLNDTEIDFSDALVSSLLKNTSLHHLNMSHNKFSSGAIDHILEELSVATNDSTLAFLRFDENVPALATHQVELLGSFSVRSRKNLLQRFINEREKRKLDEMSDSDTSLVLADQMDVPSSLQTEEFTILEEDEAVSDFYATTTNAVHAPTGDNMITVLFSAPLVFVNDRKTLEPFKKLDFELERELIWQCLKEASRDIELAFDTATHNRFLAAISKKCSCLHYSGHGDKQYLPFENNGEPQWFDVKQIKDLIESEGGASFKFVFVSACHSENAGQTFAAAGVPHVVCCRQESELKDSAALAFTRQFYLSLAVGNTVKEAFDQGCKAVRITPKLRNAEGEMQKFRLLPEDGDHNVPIFNAKQVLEWPRSLNDRVVPRTRRTSRSARRSIYSAGTSSSELSVRNMMQEDPAPSAPQFFLGREVDMFYVLQHVLNQRLVSVIGEAGIGRSSLVCALCHYINERASTMLEIKHIYFVKAKQDRRKNRSQALIERLIQKLVDADKLHDPPGKNADIETMSEAVCAALKNEKCLVVFDRVDLLDDTDETNEFPILLSNLLRETRNVKVLLTNRRPLGIPSIGEKAYELSPLPFGKSVRLFANLCPFIQTPRDTFRFCTTLVRDPGQANLLPSDPGLTEETLKIFSIIGAGVPSRIEKAAYHMTKDQFLSLMNGRICDEIVEPVEVKELN